MIKRFFIALIYFYRSLHLFDGYCKYYPSCSLYMVEAIEKRGVIKGMVLGSARIMRCHPFAKGGVDMVKQKSYDKSHTH